MKTGHDVVDWLCQENMGLKVLGGEIVLSDGQTTFGWFPTSNTVNVYRADGICDVFDNIDAFTIPDDACLLDVLHYVREYRTDKGE